MIAALLLTLFAGSARADFCFPSTCTPTFTAAGTATATPTSTATRTNSGTFTATPTAAPTKFSVAGQVTAYAGAAVAGHGVGALVASGQDVASAGGGAQNTTIATVAVVSGAAYEAVVSVSATTADTVTVVVNYTDAINTTEQNVSLVDAAAIGTNGVRSGIHAFRPTAPLAITVKYTLSSQTSTKASAWIRRVQ